MSLRYPLDDFTISQGFGGNRDYYQQFGQIGHNGLDLAASEGTPVFAADDGIIKFEGWGQNNSWMGVPAGICIIENVGGVYVGYAHLSGTTISAGDTVSKGQLIGYVGATGAATGPHLHFEVIGMPPNFNNGYAGRIEPTQFIDPAPTPDPIPTPVIEQPAPIVEPTPVVVLEPAVAPPIIELTPVVSEPVVIAPPATATPPLVETPVEQKPSRLKGGLALVQSIAGLDAVKRYLKTLFNAHTGLGRTIRGLLQSSIGIVGFIMLVVSQPSFRDFWLSMPELTTWAAPATIIGVVTAIWNGLGAVIRYYNELNSQA